MTNPIFQIKNVSVNGSEVTFDWGLKNGSDLGLNWMASPHGNDKYYYVPFSWKNSMVKEAHVTLMSNPNAAAAQTGGLGPITTELISGGVKTNTRLFSGAEGAAYSLQLRATVTGIGYSEYTFCSAPARAGWTSGYIYTMYAFNSQVNGGMPAYDENGAVASTGYTASVIPFDADAEGFVSFAKYRIVIQDGETMPTHLDEMVFFLTQPYSEHPGGVYDHSANTNTWSSIKLANTTFSTIEQEPYVLAAGGGAGAGAGESSGEALIDITYGGQLSGVRAFDHNDSVFCYIAEESEAPSVYFGTDLNDFASFEQKTIIDGSSQPMSLEGKPMSLSMKSDDGSVYLGTRSGKLYHVAYNAGTNCVAQELFSGSGYVSGVHWDSYRSECLFEVGGVIHSVDLSGTVSVKHTLAAGSMVEDFKAAPSGVAIVFRKVDFTFEVMFVEGSNWASPKASSQMIESVRGAKDFEYNSDLDMWVAATDDGQTSVGDLL
jgi:hypothetical protein